MKKNYKHINTLAQLQDELRALKSDIKIKEHLLIEDSKNYIKQFSPSHIIKKYASPSGFFKLDDQMHISSKIMSIILPIVLNKTLFRGSGFIVKALGALVTRKVGKSLDAENISGIFNAVKSIFTDKKIVKEKVKFVDYGIPPDSETY